MEYIISGAIGYFFGSIPFAYLLTKLLTQKDVRDVGSGNVGATNAFRAGGIKVAFLTLAFDMAKVIIASFVVKRIVVDHLLSHLCVMSLFAVLGHIFPVWLRFKGGKGVAPTASSFFVISPIVMIFALITWIITFMLTHISSVSALITALLSAIFAVCWYDLYDVRVMTILALNVIIILSHYSNIKRLISDSEKKI